MEREYQYYNAHKNDFLKEYNGKFIVLKDHKVIGTYEQNAEAYKETIKTEEPGSFIIQHCIEPEVVARFYSRTLF